jgi:hypothetical protein
VTSSYYEALPIYKVAMDIAVRLDAVLQSFAKGHKYTPRGNVKLRRLACLFERPLADEQEKST